MADPVLRPFPGHAFHYRDTGSPLHRLGGGWKLLGVALGGAAAVAAREPVALVLLLTALAAGYRLARLTISELWQDARWLVLQGAVVVGLYVVRDGPGGAGAGLRTAMQLGLFFLPGALLLRTTPSAQMLDAIRGRLPRRLAFGLATSLRLLPAFARELHEIWMAQRLRGARLAPREVWRPRAWRDWVSCVGLPLTVRAIRIAEEAALAAEVRGLPPREEESA
jgi:energy-coupling factor transport system permease protein